MNREQAYVVADSAAAETGFSPLFFSVQPSNPEGDAHERWNDCVVRWSEPKTGNKSYARNRAELLLIVNTFLATRAK